jgi:K+-transporting ATPase ATPase A chain
LGGPCSLDSLCLAAFGNYLIPDFSITGDGSNLKTSISYTTLEQGAEKLLRLGPVASQVAIKQLGTNGGGFYNVNSAHPFENPTPFSDLLEMLSILLIPAALTITFGKMVGDTSQGRMILIAMLIVFVAMSTVAIWAEETQSCLRFSRN